MGTVCSTSVSATSCDFEPNQRWSVRSAVFIGLLLLLLRLLEQEPIEAARRQREQVRQLADPREARAAEHLDRVAALVGAEIELDRLGAASDVVDAQHDVVGV